MGDGKRGFELVTSVSWGVVPNWLNYPLGTVLIFFFFFFDMSTQEREEEEGIRTSDLRFIRRDPHLIELPFNDSIN
jgi:hypothetical protein